MSERITRTVFIVHRTGAEEPLTQSWVSEAAARAQACTIVTHLDARMGVRHDRRLTWADLRRRKYYSAPGVMYWEKRT